MRNMGARMYDEATVQDNAGKELFGNGVGYGGGMRVATEHKVSGYVAKGIGTPRGADAFGGLHPDRYEALFGCGDVKHDRDGDVDMLDFDDSGIGMNDDVYIKDEYGHGYAQGRDHDIE